MATPISLASLVAALHLKTGCRREVSRRCFGERPGVAGGGLGLRRDRLAGALKPALKLGRRGQHSQNKIDKRDHRANLADSSLNKSG
jgi:hypothetical protein